MKNELGEIRMQLPQVPPATFQKLASASSENEVKAIIKETADTVQLGPNDIKNLDEYWKKTQEKKTKSSIDPTIGSKSPEQTEKIMFGDDEAFLGEMPPRESLELLAQLGLNSHVEHAKGYNIAGLFTQL